MPFQQVPHRGAHALSEVAAPLHPEPDAMARAEGAERRMAAIGGAPERDAPRAGLHRRGHRSIGHPALEVRRPLLAEGGNEPALGPARHRGAGEDRDPGRHPGSPPGPPPYR